MYNISSVKEQPLQYQSLHPLSHVPSDMCAEKCWFKVVKFWTCRLKWEIITKKANSCVIQHVCTNTIMQYNTSEDKEFLKRFCFMFWAINYIITVTAPVLGIKHYQHPHTKTSSLKYGTKDSDVWRVSLFPGEKKKPQKKALRRIIDFPGLRNWQWCLLKCKSNW